MLVIDVMAMAMEVMDIVFCDEGDNDCVRCNGDVMELMDIVLGSKL